MNGIERGKKLRERVFAAYAAAQETRRPNSVRPGDIGKPCTRSLWYAFRWADKLEKFEGRLLRLFETGHSQEARLIADLRRVGATVIAADPLNSAKQIGVKTLGGHMNGFLDGISSNIPMALAEWCVTECKTHGEKSFKQLESDGVAVSKPEHYAQMQIYMAEQKLEEGLYAAVNKNTDDLYFEFIAFDAHYHKRLMAKADLVAFSPRPPEKINQKPEFFMCKFCKAKDTCHGGELPERNCRTCREAVPVKSSDSISGARWSCSLHKTDLSLDQQRAGCADHRYNEGFVDGEMTEESEDAMGFKITYTMAKTGEVFDDRGPSTPQAAPVFT